MVKKGVGRGFEKTDENGQKESSPANVTIAIYFSKFHLIHFYILNV